MQPKAHASLLVAVLLSGCSPLVEGILDGKQGDSGMTDRDSSTGRVCTNDAQCLAFENAMFDCTQRCVGAGPGTQGTCATGNATPDLTPCGPGGVDICVASACVTRGCGDGYLDREATPPEYCDDGDDVNGDGCDTTCTRTCVGGAPICTDGDPCNGMETCGPDGMCQTTALAADGTACTTEGTAGTCMSGTCVAE